MANNERFQLGSKEYYYTYHWIIIYASNICVMYCEYFQNTELLHNKRTFFGSLVFNVCLKLAIRRNLVA